MRLASLLFTMLLALLVAGSASAADTKPGTHDKLVIAVVGDSLADGMWGGLYRQLQGNSGAELVRGARNSIGFTGADLTDLIDKAFAARPAQALVMMIGANDRRTIFVGRQPKAQLGTPNWIALYRGRVERFMDHAAKRKVPLVWILLPVMRDATATRDAKLVNEIVTKAAESHPNVALVETASLTSDDKGKYIAHFADLKGHKRLMRASDGVHFEQAAYELIGRRVLEKLGNVAPRFKLLLED